MRSALEALLDLGTVPVVNENRHHRHPRDRLGDNDRLAALVAQLLGADALVLLTDVDALYTAPPSDPGAERISVVEDVARLSGVSIGAVGSKVGTGGMVTKLSAAQHASTTGTATVMTSAAQFAGAVAGEDVGTFFPAHHGRRRSRLVWLRFATRGAGTLHVDEGAAQALRSRRRSLLAVGVARVEGTFPAGVPVDVAGPERAADRPGSGGLQQRGEVRVMSGHGSAELRESLGERFRRPRCTAIRWCCCESQEPVTTDSMAVPGGHLEQPLSFATVWITTFRHPTRAASTNSTGLAPASSPPRLGGS